MKKATCIVPMFINEENMQYLLKGNSIINLEEVYNNLIFKNGYDIYKERTEDRMIDSEYPNQKDAIVAKALRIIKDNKVSLEIELLDSLYYHKLREPCLKINGYCRLDDDSNIIITKVTRLTLADRNPVKYDYIY